MDKMSARDVASNAMAHMKQLSLLASKLDAMDGRIQALETPLLGEGNPKPMALAPAQAEEDGQHPLSVRYGTDPHSGLYDFDYCFVFPLPDYNKALEKQAKDPSLPADKAKCLEALAEEATKEIEKDEQYFTMQLAKRAQRHHSELVGEDQRKAEITRLFKDMFFESDQAKDFKLTGKVVTLEDARSAAIDLVLSIVRRPEEPYYSVMFTSVDMDELILCVKMHEETALEHAIRSEYPIELDMKAVQDPNKLNIKLGPGPDGLKGAAMHPAYAEPDTLIMDIFKRYPCEANSKVDSVLRKVDRIRLIYDRIFDVLDLDLLLKWNLMKDAFPLHSRERLRHLRKVWANPQLWHTRKQPISLVRHYFGETVALYFVFTEHICEYTQYAVFFSVGSMLVNFMTGGFKRDDILGSLGGVHGPMFVRSMNICFMVLWSIFFVVFLRRKFAYYSTVWSCSYEDKSEVRSIPNERFDRMAQIGPSDVDENVNDFIVGYKTRRVGRFISLAGTVFYVAFALFLSGGLLRWKAWCITNKQHTASMIISYLVTIEMKVLSAVWGMLCKQLTDYEYHRDLRDYDSAIAIKSFYVQLIVLFSTFIYVAFFMDIWGDESFRAYGETPWSYLTYQMATTFGLYLAFSLYDLISPYLTLVRQRREELHKLKDCGLLPDDAKEVKYSYVELQTKMEPYGGDEENGDYLDILGVFGFVACFGVTFPIGSLFALLYIHLQLRVDAWKLANLLRRPWPQLCKDFWQWQLIAEQLLFLASTINIGLLVTYLPPFSTMKSQVRGFYFFSFLMSAAVVSAGAWLIFPAESQDIQLANRRRIRQLYRVEQYKKERYSGKNEHENVHFHCSGDINFLHVPPLNETSGEVYQEADPIGFA